tara:strand:+ start:51 stop:1211 length:1161 start_codon:yes stop_codon:yes gene_type:complete
MAVNINTVYKAVLAIANKEQRGYITPQEFNILANQAQMDLFEQYFYDISQFQNRKGNSTEHSDMLHILEEKLAPFRVNNQPLVGKNVFLDNFTTDITGFAATGGTAANGTVTHDLPTAANNYDGGLKILQNAGGAAITAQISNFVTLTANKKYRFKYNLSAKSTVEPSRFEIAFLEPGNTFEVVVDYRDIQLGFNEFTFIADNTGLYDLQLTNSDTTNNNTFITFSSIELNEIDDTTLGNGVDEVYRMGNIHWQSSSATHPTRVDEITSHEATLYNSSSLARPTSSNPAYVRSGDTTVTIYPTPGSTDTITHDYIKTPSTVEWAFNVIQNKPIFNASAATNFELHRSEEVNLINRILVLAGLAIEDAGLLQAAGAEEIKDIQQEKL